MDGVWEWKTFLSLTHPYYVGEMGHGRYPCRSPVYSIYDFDGIWKGRYYTYLSSIQMTSVFLFLTYPDDVDRVWERKLKFGIFIR
jgi:hypothetical protein